MGSQVHYKKLKACQYCNSCINAKRELLFVTSKVEICIILHIEIVVQFRFIVFFQSPPYIKDDYLEIILLLPFFSLFDRNFILLGFPLLCFLVKLTWRTSAEADIVTSNTIMRVLASINAN